jgi:hypothetical protein
MKAKKVLLLRDDVRVVPLRAPSCVWTTMPECTAEVLVSRNDKITATQHFMSLKLVMKRDEQTCE